MQIYVGNMSYKTTQENLETLFSKFGTVESVKLVTDRETGRAKGFAFVTMDNGANEAIEALNGKEFDGRTLRINEAKPREERPKREFTSKRY
ncbi:MAG: RNA recognition motif domain-containing protein [Arcobacteraceae bacterium]|jgi:RNA recognition motif-containing protein